MVGHRVYGLHLASDLPFVSRLPRASFEQPDLVISRWPSEAPEPSFDDRSPVYTSPLPGPAGEPLYRLYRGTGGGDSGSGVEILRGAEGTDFYLDGDTVWYRARHSDRAHLIEIQLLGVVLSYVLERRGVLALHAAGVSLHGAAVGLLADNTGGKTGLAAALLGRGHALVADDILALDEQDGGFVAHAGFPQMRMWPDQAEHFVGPDWRSLPRAHPDFDKRRVAVGSEPGIGRFEPLACPLAGLYLVERRDAAELAAPQIERLRPAEALRELLRQSFTPYIVEATGLAAGRLERLSRWVEHGAVHRLVYPDGFDRLPAVAVALERHVVGRQGRGTLGARTNQRWGRS